MRHRRLTLSLVFCTFALLACDATPSDPLDPRGDLAALLSGDGAGGAQHGPLTLPGLLHAAVHTVYSEHGTNAARALVSDLRRLQDEARRATVAGDRESATARLRAVHAEELRIVLGVFGDAVVGRVIDGVALDAARLGRAADEAHLAGRELPRTRELLARVDELLATAALELATGNAHGALDAASRAAGHTDAVRHALAEAKRIPALAELFDLAVVRLRNDSGAEAARQALVRYNALRQAGEQAVRSGDRQRAHEALEAARAEQIRFVLQILGQEAVVRLTDAVERGVVDADRALAAAGAAGRDMAKLERMTAAARDMNVRARAALHDGAAGPALDLASHAAGLINAVHLAISAR